VFVEFFFTSDANVPYYTRKIQLSGISAYPHGSQSQLIRIKGGGSALLAESDSSVALVTDINEEDG
jgi:hypothetical protein